VCAEGYSKAIGYKCTKCKTATSAGIYSAAAILFGSLLLVVCYLATDLLGLCNSHVSRLNKLYACKDNDKVSIFTMGSATYTNCIIPDSNTVYQYHRYAAILDFCVC
jgi:hypothetical protein